MIDAAFGLFDRTTLDAKHDVSIGVLADIDDSFPINDSISASASNGRTRHLTSLFIRLFDGDIFGVQVN